MNRYDIIQSIFDLAADDYYSLSQSEKSVYNFRSILDAINGKGLLSYYESEAGAYSPDAIDDLYTLGLDEIASVLESANAIFPDCFPPEDIETRCEIIEDWQGEYDALFDEWTEEILEFASMLSHELDRILDELDA